MAEGHTDFCCPSPLFINPPRSQRDHVSVRVEPLQWHYLPVGRNQFLFRAQQTQMQFEDGKIFHGKSGHDQILSISQITGLTFERFTNTVCSLRFLTFLSDTFLTCLMDAGSNSQQGKKQHSSEYPNLLLFLLSPFALWGHAFRNLMCENISEGDQCERISRRYQKEALGSHIGRKWAGSSCCSGI